MSYTKQIWANGDIITADKLNYMENGIEENSETRPLVVHSIIHRDVYEFWLDATFDDIASALKTGRSVIIIQDVKSDPSDTWHYTEDELNIWTDIRLEMSEDGNQISVNSVTWNVPFNDSPSFPYPFWHYGD